ncbi:unnamed protein product [Paramecium primaurelia]|uniref:Uncharacterized protein n=1 Tax=Paramecium primaurelia TaxID=5886 RepID=A0A8S1MBL0_PARPR|nr:unnamed protein product [Paramecium primaurelia]
MLIDQIIIRKLINKLIQKYGIWNDDGIDKSKKTQTNNNNNNNNNTIQWNVPQTEVIKPPFQEIIQKLAKPIEKWDVPASKSIQQQPQQIQQAKQNTQSSQQTQKQNIIDIFDFEPQQNEQAQAPPQIQPLQPPPTQKSNNNDWGSFDNVKPQVFPQQQTQSQVLLPLDVFSQQVQQQQSIQQQQNYIFGQEQQQNQQQQLQQLYQQQQYSQPQQYYQQQQNQQTNLNLYQQNQQQSLQINYNQLQYNSINNQQQYFQVNQQQFNQNQQKLQQTKQEDQLFGDFISTQQQKQTNNNPNDLLGMLDLKKEKEELESKKQIPIVNQQIQQNQIYPDIDTFTYNYQKKQQTFSNYQYPQGR